MSAGPAPIESLTPGDVLQLLAVFCDGRSVGAFWARSHWDRKHVTDTRDRWRQMSPVDASGPPAARTAIGAVVAGLDQLQAALGDVPADDLPPPEVWDRIAAAFQAIQTARRQLETEVQAARGELEPAVAARTVLPLPLSDRLRDLRSWLRPAALLALVRDYTQNYGNEVASLPAAVPFPPPGPEQANPFAAWILAQPRRTQIAVTDAILVGPHSPRIPRVAHALARATRLNRELRAADLTPDRPKVQRRAGALLREIRANFAPLADALIAQWKWSEKWPSSKGRRPGRWERLLPRRGEPAVVTSADDQLAAEARVTAARGLAHALWKGRERLTVVVDDYERLVDETWDDPDERATRLDRKLESLAEKAYHSLEQKLKANRHARRRAEKTPVPQMGVEEQAVYVWDYFVESLTDRRHDDRRAGARPPDHPPGDPPGGYHFRGRLRLGTPKAYRRRRADGIVVQHLPAVEQLCGGGSSYPPSEAAPPQDYESEWRTSRKELLSRVRKFLAALLLTDKDRKNYARDVKAALDRRSERAGRRVAPQSAGSRTSRLRVNKVIGEVFRGRAVQSVASLRAFEEECATGADGDASCPPGVASLRPLEDGCAPPHTELVKLRKAFEQLTGDCGRLEHEKKLPVSADAGCPLAAALRVALGWTDATVTQYLRSRLSLSRVLKRAQRRLDTWHSGIYLQRHPLPGGARPADLSAAVWAAVHDVGDYVVAFGLTGKKKGLLTLIPAHAAAGTVDWLFDDTLRPPAPPAPSGGGSHA